MPQDALLTPGAAAALFVVATSLLNESSHLVVMHPNDTANIETQRAIGCAANLLEMTFEQGFRFSVERLAALVRLDTRLISPTGPTTRPARRFRSRSSSLRSRRPSRTTATCSSGCSRVPHKWAVAATARDYRHKARCYTWPLGLPRD